MFIERLGDPSSPKVLLLHGVPGSAAVWTPVVEKLSGDYEVIVPDLLGFGRSAMMPDLHATAQAEALRHALQEAGIGRAIFVGHDFGGPVSLSLYRAKPDLFSGLVLMATNAFPDTPIPFPLNAVTLPLVGDLMARILFSSCALRAL